METKEKSSEYIPIGFVKTMSMMKELPDKRINLDFIDLIKTGIYIDENLSRFKKNKYRTEEEMKTVKGDRIKWIAIIVSFLIGMGGIVANLLKP